MLSHGASEPRDWHPKRRSPSGGRGASLASEALDGCCDQMRHSEDIYLLSTLVLFTAVGAVTPGVVGTARLPHTQMTSRFAFSAGRSDRIFPSRLAAFACVPPYR